MHFEFSEGATPIQDSVDTHRPVRFKKCSKSHVPNAETAKVLREVEKGEGLIEFDSIEGFFKSLEK